MLGLEQTVSRRAKLLGAAIAVTGLLGWTATASAGTIPLDMVITGSGFTTDPTGVVTITQIAGVPDGGSGDTFDDVRIDFSTDQGDIQAIYFNLVPDFDFAGLEIISQTTLPDGHTGSLIGSPVGAQAGLTFDFGIDFGTGSSPGNVVTSGFFILSLDGVSLTQPSFYEQSDTADGRFFTIAMRLQSLGAGGGGSALIGGNPPDDEVPEPAALGLLGLGILGIGFGRRRRQ